MSPFDQPQSVSDYATNLAAAKRYLGWDNPVTLNLACGSDTRTNFWNLDVVRQWPNSPRPCDLLWDARTNVIPFPDGSIDAIVAGYLLLHVSLPHHEPLMREAFRLLKPGGRIELGEVDMYLAMRRWLAHPQDPDAHAMIWGEMGSEHGHEFEEFDRHVCGNTETTLRALLGKCGFVQVERFKQHSEAVWYELSMRAVKP